MLLLDPFGKFVSDPVADTRLRMSIFSSPVPSASTGSSNGR